MEPSKMNKSQVGTMREISLLLKGLLFGEPEDKHPELYSGLTAIRELGLDKDRTYSLEHALIVAITGKPPMQHEHLAQPYLIVVPICEYSGHNYPLNKPVFLIDGNYGLCFSRATNRVVAGNSLFPDKSSRLATDAEIESFYKDWISVAKD